MIRLIYSKPHTKIRKNYYTNFILISVFILYYTISRIKISAHASETRAFASPPPPARSG